jgi:predicted NAD/FAD-binding protein
LSRRCDVTVFEAAGRIGGHANTVTVTEKSRTFAVDTGFIVYNPHTYPNLTALFTHLDVPTRPSDMSLSISLDGGALEYSGTGFRGVFAQRKNLMSPRFWWMLGDIMRFYREAPRDVLSLDAGRTTLGDYLAARGYGRAFQDDHLLPMAAAIWSAPAHTLLDYPAAAFINFYHNHGLLRLRKRPEWRTVVGGSRAYVRRLIAPFADRICLQTPVASITRAPDGVTVRDRSGSHRRFDHVVIATHADQALAMLADASLPEQELLGAFRYSRNTAILHKDPALMPVRREAWASWNYLGSRSNSEQPVSVSYWMNHLQGLAGAPDLFVTLNPPRPPRTDTVLHEEVYEHPRFDTRALHAQTELWSLQGQRNTWFCGAHFGAGFHEDGLQSGLAAAEALCGERRPWSVPGESGRIALPPRREPDPERRVA